MSSQYLKQWFLQEKRDLPWRDDPTPYAVWVSEIMLQQTQVSVVVPYFERWMSRFPSIEVLAAASLDEVIKMWEGLGYYSRARRLHEGAQYILDVFKGQFPSTREDLDKIKGLGPYTIGAILSFAFHQKTVAVDGNVLRVMSRYFSIQEDISKAATVKKIQQLTFSFLPDEESWVINEALIELGATICSRKPKCSICPLKKTCKAYIEGKTTDIPFNSKKTQTENLQRTVAIIECEGNYLVQRGEKGKIMSDLHEFPYFDKNIEFNELAELIKDKLSIDVNFKQQLSIVEHSFTRFRVKLYPFLVSCVEKTIIPGYQWIAKERLEDFAFSSGHRKISKEINR